MRRQRRRHARPEHRRALEARGERAVAERVRPVARVARVLQVEERRAEHPAEEKPRRVAPSEHMKRPEVQHVACGAASEASERSEPQRAER